MAERVPQVLSFLLVCVLAVGAWRAAACNVSYWRRVRRLPLVMARPDELIPEEGRWNHQERRWPDPGRPGDWHLAPEVCDAYARLALLRSRRWEALSTAANLLVAALLGVVVAQMASIPGALAAAGAPFADSRPDVGMLLRSYWIPELRLPWFAAVAAGFLAVGLINRTDYGELSARYRAAARAQRREEVRVVAEPPGTGRSTARRLLARLRRRPQGRPAGPG